MTPPTTTIKARAHADNVLFDRHARTVDKALFLLGRVCLRQVNALQADTVDGDKDVSGRVCKLAGALRSIKGAGNPNGKTPAASHVLRKSHAARVLRDPAGLFAQAPGDPQPGPDSPPADAPTPAADPAGGSIQRPQTDDNSGVPA